MKRAATAALESKARRSRLAFFLRFADSGTGLPGPALNRPLLERNGPLRHLYSRHDFNEAT